MKNLSRHRPICFFLTILLLTIGWLNSSAQSLSVEYFKLLETDLTANTNGTIEYDQNGEKAALIKIITTETGFVFEAGMLGIVKTVPKVSEIWVYVPRGLQKLKIMHPQLGQVEYNIPMPIESARTYELKLISGSVRTVVEHTSTSQFVVFKVEPKTAVVFIDEDEPRSLDSDGMLSIRLSRGHHTYRVIAASFVSEAGAIEVESDKISKQVTLKSALATLTVKTTDDAEIWINEIKKGVGTWTGNLAAGLYLIESRKPSHLPQQQEIALNQQERRTVTISDPIPIYGSLEIESTPLESKAYLDNKLIGKTPIRIDKVLVGEHIIRIEKDGYQRMDAKITIEEGKTDTLKYTLLQGETHEFVDLGLSVKWATCNIGASNPEDYGDYYAWGETETKKDYSWSTYKYCIGSADTITKYNCKKYFGTVDRKKTLNQDDDVAHIKWGGNWRIPTEDEFTELIKNCTWTRVSQNGVNGYKVTSNKPGYTDRSIFLPAAGYRGYSNLNSVGTLGYYWSSSLVRLNSRLAWLLVLDSRSLTAGSSRATGQSVRPVCP